MDDKRLWDKEFFDRRFTIPSNYVAEARIMLPLASEEIKDFIDQSIKDAVREFADKVRPKFDKPMTSLAREVCMEFIEEQNKRINAELKLINQEAER